MEHIALSMFKLTPIHYYRKYIGNSFGPKEHKIGGLVEFEGNIIYACVQVLIKHF